MNFIRSNLTTILILVVCVVAIVAYQKYFAGGKGGPVLTSGMATTTGPQLLSEINSLKQVTLDPSIFSSPSFTSLVDYGVSIPPEPHGRPDPFAPVSGVGAPQGGSAGVSPSSVGRASI